MGTKLARNLLEAAVEPRSPGHPHLCSRYAFKSRSLFSALFFVHDFLFTSQWYVTSLQTSTPCLLGAEGIRKDLDVQSLLLCPPAHRVNVVDPWNMTRSYWRAVDLWAGRWGISKCTRRIQSCLLSMCLWLFSFTKSWRMSTRATVWWTMFWASAWDGDICLAVPIISFAMLLTFLCHSYPSFHVAFGCDVVD